jgi:ATP-dependent helicase/nuclease subunit B
MTTFLNKTAEYLITKYGDEVSGLCIVLPNRRGGLYLKKSLSSLIGKTIWSPEIYAIEDFTAKLSGFRLMDNISLLFEMYEVHKEIEGKKADSFEEFISWGPQLLGDFNDIDSYLADPFELFGHLSEARAIALWNLDQKPLTDFQKNYLRFYNSLNSYYDKLREKLVNARQGYAGMLLRVAAEMIGNMEEVLPWQHIIFSGFNALTKAEEIIIGSLKDYGKAEMIWDADQYYLEDEGQEAGEFLRKWRKKWGQKDFHWVGNELATQPKTITITGIPYNIGQVKYCGELLSQIPENGFRPEETAVVLMDEQLLIPLLNSIPGNIDSLNVTMGLSLKQSSYFSLFDAIFRMHENLERFTQSSKQGRTLFYYRDVLEILQHPSMTALAENTLKNNRFLYGKAIAAIKNGNRIFLAKEDIISPGTNLFHQEISFLEPVFTPIRTPEEAITCIKQLIVHLRDSVIETMNRDVPSGGTPFPDIRIEFLFALSQVIHQVSSVMSKYKAVNDLRTVHRLFTQVSESTTLPFYGEPLKGLQVMGMLETRTLDFRNVIMLSVNEDLIPGGKMTHSFIPYDIRKSFHLPVYHQKNAIYAYHFYRLLQRAENVNLIYVTEPDELGGGEKSRFIKQTRQELPLVNPKINFTDKILSAPSVTAEAFREITVTKSDEVIQKLREKAKQGMSPTALNSYRRCRLQFYFSHVAGIEERKELEETIDPQILGQAVHDVLEQLFSPFVNRPVLPGEIDVMILGIPDLVDKAFLKKYHGPDISLGKNHLMVNVAQIMVRNFLKEEKRNIEKLQADKISWEIKCLEKPVHGDILLDPDDESTTVHLKGFIDRVDRIGDTIRIIDYKTGVVDKKELTVREWSGLQDDPGIDKSFQLLMYAYLLDEFLKNGGSVIKAGTISLRRLKEGFLPVITPVGQDGRADIINSETLKNFEMILHTILAKVFDPAIPFSQTEDTEICRNCPFLILCGR